MNTKQTKQMTPEESGGKILNIKTDLKKCLQIKKSTDEYCSHKYIVIDKDERIVRCQKCDAVVEPFDFILQCAYEERRLFWQIDDVSRQIKQLTEEKNQLQKDVVNLKSQKRRLS